MDIFTTTFILQILLSFIVGGGFITLLTFVAQRFGSRLGGFISGLPSTATIVFLFIGISGGVSNAVEAAKAIPIAITMFGVFLVWFAIVTRYGFWKGYISSIVVWFIGAFIISSFSFENILVSLLVLVGGLLFLGVVLYQQKDIPRVSGKKILLSTREILIRAFISGALVAGVVLASRLIGATWGGILGAFPVASATTFLILYYREGLPLVRAMTKTVLPSALLTISFYAVMVFWLYPVLGLFWGTVLGYIATMIFALPVYIMTKKINSV